MKRTAIRPLSEQSDEEKMVILKIVAHQNLGQKWQYYRKIKDAGKSGKLFKEKSLFKEMKATQSALKFTSKNALRLYNLAYQNCVKEIKSFAITDEVFPELPDESDDSAVKAMIPEQDAVIIAWTPLKFLLTSKQLREKGQASERHTEGLIAKLIFKVAGFYAVPENWNNRKLSFYLDRINKDSSYPEVAQKLEPLKKDLYTFTEEFEQIKFGQAVLAKDTTGDADAFDDAMEIDSFEAQVKTLYWHSFIYKAIESFLFRYYLTMVSSTVSIHAIRYLSTIFEPAITHAIDMSVLFDGSFDTEISKKRFRKPFVDLLEKKAAEAPTKNIKTRQGIFEIYNYNLPLLSQHGVPFEINKDFDSSSYWWQFIEKEILGKNRFDLDRELSHTSYNKLAQNITAIEQLNKNLAQEKTKCTAELSDLKDEINGLKQEINALSTAHKDANPEAEQKQLALKREQIEKQLQETDNEIKKLREVEKEIVNSEKQLAQERDSLLAEENGLKKTETELKEAVKSGKTEEADDKLKAVSEKLRAVSTKRNGEIKPEFERAQAKHTEILKKLATLEQAILKQKKQKEQLTEEQTAFEEKESQYQDSRNKIVNALKNTEKTLATDSKTIVGIEQRIVANKAEIADFQEKRQTVLAETRQKIEELNHPKTRTFVLMYILTLLITSSQKRKEAWLKVLERFKQRLISDHKLAQNRVEEIKKESKKKLREMAKKSSKLKSLKQTRAVEDFAEEMDRYQQSTDQKCKQILVYAKQEADIQKQRITRLFQKISQDKKRHNALPARRMVDLILRMEEGDRFKAEFMSYLIQDIAQKYHENLTPLYSNMFGIFRPTLLNKVGLIQALNRSSDANGVKLELSPEEHKGFNGIINGIKDNLKKHKPDIFDSQVKIHAVSVTIDRLLDIKIDSASLKLILEMNFSLPKNPKAFRLNPALIKRILELNHIMTPVPENSLIMEGKENEKNPANKINTSLLKKLSNDSA